MSRNWIPNELFQAICCHLNRSAAEIKIVLHIGEQTIRYKKAWDWSKDSQLMQIANIGRAMFYRVMRHLLENSILEGRKEGRKRFYRVNQNWNAWGTKNTEMYQKVFPLVEFGKVYYSRRNRSTIVDGKGLLYETPLYITFMDYYNKDLYSPRGHDLKIPFSKLKSWPPPILQNPGKLEDYVKENTSSWPFEFETLLTIIVKQRKNQHVHPDDIKFTIDEMNNLQERFAGRNEFMAYAIDKMERKITNRIGKMNNEVHEWTKKGEI